MILGIDFGTSNSAAACVRGDGSLLPIALDEGNTSMPTALFFPNVAGPTQYGAAAVRGYREGGDGRLMRSIKSRLGSRLMDDKTLVNGHLISYFDIVVLFFKELKSRAEAQLGETLTRAVLGRPVHFVDDAPERDALAQATLGRAAKAAGFKEVQFQLEPIAAAFDFEQRIDRPTTTLIVDIGGGTSDFTVIRLDPARRGQTGREKDILATGGVHIGGTNFDQVLNLKLAMPTLGLGHIGKTGREVPSGIFFDLSTWHLIHTAYTRKSLTAAQELKPFYSDTALHERLMHALAARHGHRILAMIEAGKIECSVTGEEVQIDLSCVTEGLDGEAGAAVGGADGAGASRPLQVPLNAPAMAQVLDALLGRVVQCAQDCVAAGGERIDVVYLTGGSSALLPLISRLQVAFPDAHTVHGDRFGGVAAGLAYFGASHRIASATAKHPTRAKAPRTGNTPGPRPGQSAE